MKHFIFLQTRGNSLISFLPFIIIGAILFFIYYKYKSKQLDEILEYSIYGALLGIPLSYFLQKYSSSLYAYFQGFDNIFKNKELISNVILSMIIFAIVGAVIGYFINKNKSEKVS